MFRDASHAFVPQTASNWAQDVDIGHIEPVTPPRRQRRCPYPRPAWVILVGNAAAPSTAEHGTCSRGAIALPYAVSVSRLQLGDFARRAVPVALATISRKPSGFRDLPRGAGSSVTSN